MADDNSTFVGMTDQDDYRREPYGVGVLDSFLDYRAEIERALSFAHFELNKSDDENPNVIIDPDNIRKNAPPKDVTKNIQTLIDDELADIGTGGTVARTQFGRPNVADCSIFGNDVINPYVGFCEDDDIHFTDYTAAGVDHPYGMGRVYEEIYNSTQQIVYFQVGIPRYKNLGDFISGSVDENANNLAETGDVSLYKTMKSFVTKATVFALKLPIWPLEQAWKLFSSDARMYRISDFFYFREEMLLYYRYVNSMLASIAVNLGLYHIDWLTDGNVNASAHDELPSVLKEGPDIFKILQIRSRRFGEVTELKSIDQAMEEYANDENKKEDNSNLSDVGKGGKIDAKIKKWFQSLWEGAKTTALDGNKFLAFRIEKGQDNASETISNTTRDSSLASRLNGMVDEYRNVSTGAEGAATGFRAWANQKAAALDKVKGLWNSLVNSNGVKSFVDNFSNLCDYGSIGTGYYDLPQEWGGANFTRSVSLNFRFRSKTGGDNVSIFTNIFIPLTCLMAMALPRATGKATYTSPFIIRCWCRGMFSIPAGYITTMNITRGDSEYGWSRLRLPTVVNVSLSITDLSPILFIGMADSGGWLSGWGDIFTSNTKFHDYIATLTGMGIKQRIYYFTQVKKNIATKILQAKNGAWYTNPIYAGMRFGDTAFGRVWGAFAGISYMRVARNENSPQ